AARGRLPGLERRALAGARAKDCAGRGWRGPEGDCRAWSDEPLLARGPRIARGGGGGGQGGQAGLGGRGLAWAGGKGWGGGGGGGLERRALAGARAKDCAVPGWRGAEGDCRARSDEPLLARGPRIARCRSGGEQRTTAGPRATSRCWRAGQGLRDAGVEGS